MQVRPIVADTFPAVRALLAANALPTDDLDDTVALLGAFDGEDLLGVVGLQRCGGVGLLRSLAVTPAARDRGIARALCDRVVTQARDERLAELWLLTTTAQDYFARQGFAVASRDAAPPAVRQTPQFASLCPSTAVLMRRGLESR